MMGKLRMSRSMRKLRRHNRVSTLSNALYDDSDSEQECDRKAQIPCKQYTLKYNDSIIQLSASNIAQIPPSLICYIFDYMTFNDLMKIRDVYNKYLSIDVLWKYLTSKNNNKNNNDSFCCNKFLFIGKFENIKSSNLIPTKQILPTNYCSMTSNANANVREFGTEPAKKRRRLTMNSTQIAPKNERIRLLKVSENFIIYANDEQPPNHLFYSRIHIRSALSMEYIDYILFKDGVVNIIEVYDNLIILCGEKKGTKTNEKKGQIKIYEINVEENISKIKGISDLSVSSMINGIQIDSDKNLLIFITDTNHICFWNIKHKQSCSICAHRLNITNNAFVLSMDCIFIASPAQIHLMRVADVLLDANNTNNAINKKRMCVTVHNKNNGDVCNDFPNDSAKYIMLTIEEKRDLWEEWSDKRIIKEIKRIEFGVVYFIENESEFCILRCDTNNMIKNIKKNQDLNISFVEIKQLDPNVYVWLDGQGQFPHLLDGIQCKIKLIHNNNTRIPLKIITIYCFENLIFVMDNKYSLWIYTDFGLFIRKIYIYDKIKNDDNEQVICDRKQCPNIGFDGQKLWVLINENKLYSVPFKAP